jgi:CBS domain-containing protein
MLRAKDIMTKNVITVKRDQPIYEAVELLSKHNISGIPVVEDDMTLVGILSEKDVLALSYTENCGTNKTVDDFMTQPAIHFDENEKLRNVCNFMAKNIIRRAPVTSRGKVVGIISIKNILDYILQSNQASVCTEQLDR